MNPFDVFTEHLGVIASVFASALVILGGAYRLGFNHGAAGKSALVTANEALKNQHAAEIALVDRQIAFAKDREEDLLREVNELKRDIAEKKSTEVLTTKVQRVGAAVTEVSTATAAIGSALVYVPINPSPKIDKPFSLDD